jgi:hypothetical protein
MEAEMKRFCLMCSVVFVCASTAAWANTNAFEVAVKGTITRNSGKLQITNASLLVSPSNKLVLIVDTDDDDLEVVEVDPATTNIVRTILATFVSAFLDSGKFNADFEANGSGPQSAVTDFPDGTPSFNGDLQADGKATLTGSGKITASAKLVGVWNDPNAQPFDAEPAVFKGTMKSLGLTTVPTDF